MTQAGNDDATTWNVIAQSPTTDVSANGQFQRGFNVTYRTGKGNVGTIFVPKDTYANLDNVKAIIGEAAMQMDMVSNLSESS